MNAEMSDATLPRYGQPPVIEVVAGIEFAQMGAEFSALAVAVAEEFSAELAPVGFVDPIPPSQPYRVGSQFQQIFRFGGEPAALRMLLESRDSVWLLQVQDNRIVVNWRKAHPGSTYPGFNAMRSRLTDCVTRISALDKVGPLAPHVTEFTYVNAVTGLEDSSVGAFSVLAAPAFDSMPGQPLATRFQIVRDLPETRAQVSVSSEPRSVADVSSVIMTITTNVFCEADATVEDALHTLHDAHRISRDSFSAVTTETMRKTWGENADEPS